MRIYLIILLLAASIIQVCAGTAHAQNISISVKNVSLKTVLLLIEQKSGYEVFYNNKHLENANPVTLSLNKKGLKEVLDKCFMNQPLTYEIVRKTIVVKPKPKQALIKQKSILPIRGRVVDETDKPLQGVNISIKGTTINTVTDNDGVFELDVTGESAVLVLSYVGFQKQEYVVDSNVDLLIKMKESSSELETVNISTGYQQLPRERLTGSFGFIDNALINRSVSTNILQRIENLTPGLLFNHGDAANTDEILIRGRSTIYSEAAPLIVLDNFPYDGDIRNINPNDVESITLLKDASAASIWGAQSGNGVIVITTKKGKSVQPRIEFNTNTTLIQKPDLKNISSISAADYIDLEKYLFDKGFYNGQLTNIFKPALTPVSNFYLKKRMVQLQLLRQIVR
jgi:TonB-dependent SusC/RagA subfamily outer membrane receptor